MTNYEIREYSWKSKDENTDTLYTFDSSRDFAVYSTIHAKTHESVTIHYDREKDTIYLEE